MSSRTLTQVGEESYLKLANNKKRSQVKLNMHLGSVKQRINQLSVGTFRNRRMELSSDLFQCQHHF